MIINGKTIAQSILFDLKTKVETIKSQSGITPTMGVLLIGDDPGSQSYVRQKDKTAAIIGAKVITTTLPYQTAENEIKKYINESNDNPLIHGYIIQRPLPPHISNLPILQTVRPTKDIDGFVPHSPFEVPVAKAVMLLINSVYNDEKNRNTTNVVQWLHTQSIVVMGRGETAGKPIADALVRQGYNVTVVHSKTKELDKLKATTQADIIISCVGKRDALTKTMIKTGVILISVGISRDESGKLVGDYTEDGISQIASYYTPTPGGVGPVNVACLMDNLVTAAALNIKNTIA